MKTFAARHPAWAGIITFAVLILLYLMFAIWPEWLTDAIGSKKIFLNALFNGVTLGGLYFLVARQRLLHARQSSVHTLPLPLRGVTAASCAVVLRDVRPDARLAS